MARAARTESGDVLCGYSPSWPEVLLLEEVADTSEVAEQVLRVDAEPI
jgi:hypothetical protein